MTNINNPSPPQTDCAYVYDSLREDIMSGRIRPDERIIESYYAQKLGVSRTPVREALRLLERDGLVDFQPKRGATARAVLKIGEVEEVFRLRSLLQLSCVRDTVENLTPRELSMMAGCNAACAAALDLGDIPSFYRHYERFNKLLMEGCKMPLLIKMLMMLENYDPVTCAVSVDGGRPDLQIRRIAVSGDKQRRRVLREHMNIWSALERRDVAAYTAALKKHINSCNNDCREKIRRLHGGQLPLEEELLRSEEDIDLLQSG